MKIAAVVKRLVFANKETGFCMLEVEADARRFLVVGESAVIEEDRALEMEGHFTEHELYGHCFVTETISASEFDEELTEAGVPPRERQRILAAAEDPDFNVFDLELPYGLADQVAQMRGQSPGSRIVAAVRAILSGREAKRGLPETVLQRAVSKGTEISMIEVQATISNMLSSGDLHLTRDGILVLGSINDQARKIAELVPDDMTPDNPLDEVRWSLAEQNGLVHCESESEKQAIRGALESRWAVIHYPDHQNAVDFMINLQTTLREMVPGGVATIVNGWTWEKLDLVAGSHHVWIVGDLEYECPMAPVMRALYSSRKVPLIKVVPRVNSELEEARATILSPDHGLAVTCLASEDGVKYSNENEPSEALTLFEEQNAPRAQDYVIELVRQESPESLQVVCFGEKGPLGAAALGAVIRREMSSGVPCLGRFTVGDKLLLHGRHGVVAGPGELQDRLGAPIEFTEDAVSSWALPLRLLFGGHDSWRHIVAVVDDRDHPSWRDTYQVLSRAHHRVTIVGSRRALRRLTGRAERAPERLEALHAILRDRGPKKTSAT